MVVGGADEAEAQAACQRSADSVGGLAAAHRMGMEREGSAIVLRIAVLGEDLDDRRAGFVELVPIDAPMPSGIRQVVRDHQRLLFHAEAAQLGHAVRVVQRSMVAGKDDALVAEPRGMPLEAEEGAELAVAVRVGDHLLHPGPGLPQAAEALGPVLLASALHALHVVPAGVAGEGEEVEMRAGNLGRSFDRAYAVPMRIVVVDVAVEDRVGHVAPAGHPARRALTIH